MQDIAVRTAPAAERKLRKRHARTARELATETGQSSTPSREWMSSVPKLSIARQLSLRTELMTEAKDTAGFHARVRPARERERYTFKVNAEADALFILYKVLDWYLGAAASAPHHPLAQW